MAILLIGFALISGILVAQAVVSRSLTSSTESQSRRLERDSILSVEALSRIAFATDQLRLLLDDRISAADAALEADIDRRHAAVTQEIDRASQDYTKLIDFPAEATEWQQARGPLIHLQGTISDALSLWREHLDIEARAKWKTAHTEYPNVKRALATLIAMNRTSANDAIQEIEDAERRTRNSNDRVTLVALLSIAALAQWISRRVLAYERQLKQASELLAMRNQDLDAFAGRVAHDLKNALGPIVLSHGLLRRAAADPERVRHFAQRAEVSAHQAMHIIDALLDFSRASQGAQSDEMTSVRGVIESVVEECRARAAQLDATIELSAVPDLAVRCQAGLLHVVLINLVGNAVKYLEGQRERRVQVLVSRDGASCRFEVADTGPGIPKHEQTAIFEPFYRGEGVRGGAGIGLGLATTRRIVDACGGRIAVDSEQGHGTRFIVWFPLAAPDRLRSGPPNHLPSDDAPGMSVNRQRTA